MSNDKQNILFNPEAIGKILNAIWQKRNMSLVQSQIQWQRIMQMRIWDFMADLSNTLYECFKNCHYPHLHSIQSPQEIRIFTFKKENDTYLFNFRLSKTSEEKIPNCVLESIYKSLNADIVSTQRNIAVHFGEYYLAYNYPHLMHGIWVTKIQDSITDVVITVLTRIQP